MQTPGNIGGILTERIMAALTRADVLKPDEPNFPRVYNAAYSAVYGVLDLYNSPWPPPEKAAPPADEPYRPFPPAVHGNVSHGYAAECSACAAAGVERKTFARRT